MNLASRLCDEAEPGDILVSERVYSEIEDIVTAESAGSLALKGFMKPVASFRIIDVMASATTRSNVGPRLAR
jgi:class 3 adenylate cyclase